jgi:phosphatidylserine/phosphatidylglycerophosphate/cardiolipin synthase-like enzyme
VKVALRRLLLLALLLAWGASSWWQASKPLPAGLHTASASCIVPAAELALIADISAADAWGRRVNSQGIFDEVLAVVRQARRFVLLDFALLGDAGSAGAPQRALARELAQALAAQRRAHPELRVLLITDPVNEAYAGAPAAPLELLRAAGIEVVTVDLDALRDSNLLWSGLWRLGVHWWDARAGAFGVALRRLNYKSDHRKVIIADDGAGALAALVGSANPDDPQSAWSNVALRAHGAALTTLLESELAVARFSGWRGASGPYTAAAEQCSAPGAELAPAARLQVLTEGAFGEALRSRLAATVRGDAVDVAMYYLGERAVQDALLGAARRGVAVRLILDPGEDDGASVLPNQPAATELVARSAGAIRVRWYRTHGERFHDALVMIYDRERLWLAVGSANLTRRSLDDYNLEADLAVECGRGTALAQQALGLFDSLWSNRAALGIEYTADFAVFADASQTDYWLGRLLEAVGFSAF